MKYLLAPTCQAVGDGSVEVPVGGPDPDDLGSPGAVLRDHAAVLRRAELRAVVVHVRHGDQDTGHQAEMSMGVHNNIYNIWRRCIAKIYKDLNCWAVLNIFTTNQQSVIQIL